jgi:hypothetical protein
MYVRYAIRSLWRNTGIADMNRLYKKLKEEDTIIGMLKNNASKKRVRCSNCLKHTWQFKGESEPLCMVCKKRGVE